MRKSKILLSIMLVLTLLTYGCAPAYRVDATTGIVIKQDSPVNAVQSFYELQAAGSFDSAHKILDQRTGEKLSANDLNYYWTSTTPDSYLAKVLKFKSKGHYAAVVFVRMVNNEGSASYIVGSEVLEKRQGQWFILRNPDTYSQKQLLHIITLLAEAEDAALGLKLEEFSQGDRQSIKDQIYNFKGRHLEYIADLEDRIKNPKKYEELEKKSVSEDAYKSEEESNHY